MTLKWNPFTGNLDFNDGNVGPQGPAGVGSANAVFVDSLSDLPTPVGNVITLDSGLTYIMTGALDLLGNRIVIPANGHLQGIDQGQCVLTSSGLSAVSPLITVATPDRLENLTLTHDYALDGAGGGSGSFQMRYIVFNGSANFSNWTTVSFRQCNFVNKPITFSGSISSLVFESVGIIATSEPTGVIRLAAGFTNGRRVRFNESIGIVSSGAVGITVDPTAVIGDEQLRFVGCNFSGAGTYIDVIDLDSDIRVAITDCTGLPNISVGGKLYMNDNATATVVGATNTWYKIAGTTTNSAGFMRNFAGTNNRLTSNTTVTRKYLVKAETTFSAGNNEKCTFGIYSSSFGNVRPSSVTSTTYSNTAGTRTITTSAVEEMTDGDYVEVWVQNNTATTNITVAHLSLTVIEI